MSRLYWSYTFNDLNTKLKTKVGFEQAKIVQEYQTFSLLLSQLFGSNKKTTRPPSSADEAEAMWKAAFG